MHDSGPDHLQDPVDDEDVAAVANPEELMEEDKVEEEGEDVEEGRAAKKAEV